VAELPGARAHLTWAKGGAASFVTVKDDAVTLRSTIPSPPGSRLDATFASDPPAAFKIKIHTSKLEADGTFMLKGRVLEATRALRERIATLVG
jgi:hypothetical protein